MVLALLTSALLSIVCFIVTLLTGFMVIKISLAQHVLFGFFTTFLVTLTQSMTMFYFIGTGKQVKDLVTALPSGPQFIQRTKVFKAKVFPPSLWAMLFTMATMGFTRTCPGRRQSCTRSWRPWRCTSISWLSGKRRST
jgi:hypothetical protein